jgi:predicted transcriptional regulator
MVKAVYAMLEADQQEDWWDEISEGERQAVISGLEQVLEGKVRPHDQVMEKYSKWLTK